jgi:hypothetical protein
MGNLNWGSLLLNEWECMVWQLRSFQSELRLNRTCKLVNLPDAINFPFPALNAKFLLLKIFLALIF